MMKVLTLFYTRLKLTLACQCKQYNRMILLILSCFIVSTSYADNLKEIKVGGISLFSEVSKEMAEVLLADMFTKQLVDLGIKIKYKVYDSPEELMQAFDKKEIDTILTSGVDVITRKNQLDSNIYTLLDQSDRGVNKFNYVLVTKHNSLSELKGKKIAYVNARAMSKTLIDYIVLKELRQNANAFFSSINPVKDPQTAILDVFFGKSDAAIVDKIAFKTATELNPQLGKKINVILTSPAFYNVIVATRKDKADELKSVHKKFHMNPERTLNTGSSEPSLESKSGRGFGYTIQSLNMKDLDEIEAFMQEINDMKRSIK